MQRRSWFDVNIPTSGGHDLYFNSIDREIRTDYLNEMEKNGTISRYQKLAYMPYQMSNVESIARKRAHSVKNPHGVDIIKYFLKHQDAGEQAMRTAKLWNKAVRMVRQEIAGKRSKKSQQPLINALYQLIKDNPPKMFPQKQQRPRDPSPPPPPPAVQPQRKRITPTLIPEPSQPHPQRKRITPVLITNPEPQPKPQRKRITPKVSDDPAAALAELNAKRKKYANALAEYKKGKGPAPAGNKASYGYFVDWLDQAIPYAPPHIPNFKKLSKQIEKRRQARK